MASERLTKDIRESIVKGLCEQSPYKKEFGEEVKNLLEDAKPYIEAFFPKEVLEMFRDEDRRKYFKMDRVGFKYGDSWRDYFYFEEYFPSCNGEGLSILKEVCDEETYDSFVDRVKKIQGLHKQQIAFRNKLNCTLEGFKTSGKLKSDFPEAYDVYYRIVYGSNSPSTQNGCDQVESLRAILSTSKTKDEVK